MNENEELLTATEQASTDEQVIDLDDVEGHGLREVAAGLGAAAVLAGGASAAAVSLDVHPSLPGGGGVQASASVGDPISTTDAAVDAGLAAARADRDAALRLAAAEAGSASSTAGGIVTGAERTADAFVDAAANLAAGATTTAKTVARGATNTTFATVSATGSTAGRTTEATATTAKSTTSSTATTASRKAATVLSVTSRAVSVTTTELMMTVADLNPTVGTGANTEAMGGWISIQVGGRTLAQVQVVDGKANVSLDTKNLVGQTITFVYSGDSVHASSTRSVTL